MYVTQSIKRHQRCLDLLDLIVKAKQAYENARHTLFVFDNTTDNYHPIRLMNSRHMLEKKMKKYEAMRTRLVLWYGDALQSIIQDALPIENVVTIAERKLLLTA